MTAIAATRRSSTGRRTFRSLRHRNARIVLRRAAVSNVGTWLQLTAMSLLVYRPHRARRPTSASPSPCSSCRCCCSGRGPAPSPTAATSGAMAIITQAAARRAGARARACSTSPARSTSRSSGRCRSCSAWSTRSTTRPGGASSPSSSSPHDIANATSLNTAVMTGSRIFGPALAALLVDTDRHGVVLPAQRRRRSPRCSISLLLLRTSTSCTRRRGATRRPAGPRGAALRAPQRRGCS